jgi:hypothetical protein
MKAFRNVLIDALMRSLFVEIVGISGDDALQLVLVEDEEVVSTLPLK